MKKLLLLLLIIFSNTLFASTISATITQIRTINDKDIVTMNVDIPIQKGMSGYVVHHFEMNHQIIVANLVVTDYNNETKMANAEIHDFTMLEQDALPDGNWSVQIGDEVILAFGYSRALLIAPTEESYYHITKAVPSLEWIHPDKFAAFLSYRGHPTPLQEDFQDFCIMSATGLLYIYSEEILYTMDCKSFVNLQITPAPYHREKARLPFFSRIENIDAAWWGEGSDKLISFDLHYLELIKNKNPNINLSEQLAKAKVQYQKNLEPTHKEIRDARKKTYNPLSKPRGRR